MGKKKTIVLPQQASKLKSMGEQIRIARLRRKLPAEVVAERAGVSRQTIDALEKGSPSVSIGILANVLLALGLHEDILLIAKDEILGRTLQDLNVKVHERAPKREKQ